MNPLARTCSFNASTTTNCSASRRLTCGVWCANYRNPPPADLRNKNTIYRTCSFNASILDQYSQPYPTLPLPHPRTCSFSASTTTSCSARLMTTALRNLTFLQDELKYSIYSYSIRSIIAVNETRSIQKLPYDSNAQNTSWNACSLLVILSARRPSWKRCDRSLILRYRSRPIITVSNRYPTTVPDSLLPHEFLRRALIVPVRYHNPDDYWFIDYWFFLFILFKKWISQLGIFSVLNDFVKHIRNLSVQIFIRVIRWCYSVVRVAKNRLE